MNVFQSRIYLLELKDNHRENTKHCLTFKLQTWNHPFMNSFMLMIKFITTTSQHRIHKHESCKCNGSEALMGKCTRGTGTWAMQAESPQLWYIITSALIYTSVIKQLLFLALEMRFGKDSVQPQLRSPDSSLQTSVPCTSSAIHQLPDGSSHSCCKAAKLFARCSPTGTQTPGTCNSFVNLYSS